MAETTLTQQVNNVVQTLTEDIKNNKLELPSPPDILVGIRSLISSDRANVDDVSTLIIQDPNISGRLIKVANCALFGARNHVTSVKAAVSRLGLSKVQNLIIGLSIAQNMMQSRTKGLDQYFSTIWQQSNLVAALSYTLAIKKSSVDPEQALLAGMIHNIGCLPLILRLSRIPELADNPKVFKMVADVVVPKLYPTAGKLVMKSWNFSPDIINVALSHRQLTREEEDKAPISLDDIVLVAYTLSTYQDYSELESNSSTFTESVIFKKFWNDNESALNDLNLYQEEINEMRQAITN
jgi:HD-like signal output (HDOD) protein